VAKCECKLSDRIQQQDVRSPLKPRSSGAGEPSRSDRAFHRVKAIRMARRNEQSKIAVPLSQFREGIKNEFVFAGHRTRRDPERCHRRESRGKVWRKCALHVESVVFQIAEYFHFPSICANGLDTFAVRLSLHAH